MGDHRSLPDENTNTRGFQPHRPCSTNGKPCQQCIGLLELESQLEEARKVYTDLLARHRAMKTTVNQAHDPISRRFPTEIVARIFDFSVPRLTTVGAAKQVVPDDFNYSAPLKLGAVCTTWREIAWSTPSLWTFISIRFNPLKFPARGILAQQWLQRSGCLPLYLFLYAIDLDITNSDKDVREKGFYPLIKTINTCSDRWRVLDVGLPASLSTLLRPGSATNICASIHTLRLSYKPSPEENRFNEEFNAPSLAPIAISIFGLRTRSLKIQWDRLTSACASYFRLEDVIEFLIRAPRLKSCTLQNQSSNFTEATPLAYSHTELASLHVKNAHESFGPFLAVISLPALRHLTLDCRERPSEPILPILMSFLRRSQCSLTCLSFTIRSESQRWSDILSLLYATPSIEQLMLDVETHPPSHGKIFRQFAEAFNKSRSTSQTTEVLLPKLLDFKHREFGRQKHSSIWRSLAELLTASAADLKTVNKHPLPKMTLLLISDSPNRAFTFTELRLSDDKLIDRDLIPDFIKIIHNGVLLGIYEMYYLINDKNNSITAYYYDLIEASMRFHQFPQQDIDRYAALALPLPSDKEGD